MRGQGDVHNLNFYVYELFIDSINIFFLLYQYTVYSTFYVLTYCNEGAIHYKYRSAKLPVLNVDNLIWLPRVIYFTEWAVMDDMFGRWYGCSCSCTTIVLYPGIS